MRKYIYSSSSNLHWRITRKKLWSSLVGVRTSQTCVGFYFLFREPRGNREISWVALGMNEIGVRRSNSYGLVDLTYCSEYTKKKLKRRDFLAFILTVRLLLCRCNYELPSRQIGHSMSLPRISEKLSNMIHQKWRKGWQDANPFKKSRRVPSRIRAQA